LLNAALFVFVTPVEGCARVTLPDMLVPVALVVCEKVRTSPGNTDVPTVQLKEFDVRVTPAGWACTLRDPDARVVLPVQLPDHATFPVILEPLCVRLSVVAHESVNAPVEPGIKTFVGPHAPVMFGPTVTDAFGALASNLPSLTFRVT
jgi:hypothetical protein